MLVPALMAAGALRQRWLEPRSAGPITAMALVYAAAYLSSGSIFSTNFPWYFVPIVPAACVLAGAGAVWLMERVGARRDRAIDKARRARKKEGAEKAGRSVDAGRSKDSAEGRISVRWAPAAAGVWIAVAALPMLLSAQHLTENAWRRERIYAAVARWAGEELPAGTTLAANEIGAVGFYLPETMRVLDLYGLLRRPGQMKEIWVDELRRERPEVLFGRPHLSRRRVLATMEPGMYRWLEFVWAGEGTLEVGLRSDLPRELDERVARLDEIYGQTDLADFALLEVKP